MKQLSRGWALLLLIGLILFPAGAASLAADETPRILHVGMVAPDMLGITVQAGRIIYGEQHPYKKQPGDTVKEKGHQVTVQRKGVFLGWLVGHDRQLIYTEDRLAGRMLNTGWADQAAYYRISSKDDPAYEKAAAPLKVFRKSKPSDFGRWNGWPYKAPIRHILYLKLPQPLTSGRTYALSFEDNRLPSQTIRFDPAVLRSEAVHVSHLGFRPDDPAKVAFLSCWMGSGGGVVYDDTLKFNIIDQTGRAVHTGPVLLSKKADDRTEDAYKKNYSGTNVYLMDFTPLRTPGIYRVSVEGIGCSYAFEIKADTWQKVFYVSARGFYHQRSGIELGPPFTDFKRPKCFTPGEGIKLLHSDCALMDSGNGLNAKGTDKGNFGNLVKGRTDRPVADGWGGYMDAGDWDRRIQHLIVSRYLIELAELFPDTFSRLSLNIPESKTPLPDVVDEALFNLDCYRRMQTAEDGIRGGIESSEHPRHGECS
ncbi:cellulase N-terminal Ig-like domain-containing protein [Planctomycetota bacterium]